MFAGYISWTAEYSVWWKRYLFFLKKRKKYEPIRWVICFELNQFIIYMTNSFLHVPHTYLWARSWYKNETWKKNINSEIKLICICFDEIKTGVGNISTIISFSQGLRCDCQEKRGSLARITMWQFIMCHEVRRLKLGRINKPWPHVLVIALRFQYSKFQKLYFLKVELKED
jgi:hypothetical protein